VRSSISVSGIETLRVTRIDSAGMGAIVVEAVEDDATLAAWLELRNAILPWWPMDLESVLHARARARARQRVELVARVDGELAGGGVAAVPGTSGDAGVAFGNVFVPVERRRAGIGSAVFARVANEARGWGKTRLEVVVSETDGDGLAFLRPRGFEEVARSWQAVLPLARLVPEAVDVPPGVTITTLDVRPDLARSLYEVEQEAVADIPAPEPGVVGSFEEWRRREVDSPLVRPESWFLAVADEQVVGHALLILQPSRPGVGWHEMTGVRRAWRGRGVAAALKRAQIAWAVAHGLERLETETHADNVPMRRLNERLGYLAEPATVTLRGPLPD
jgi:mycothiol synthase